MSDEAGRRLVVIEGVTPEIDGGRFPIKRVVGEKVFVEADAFASGHDAITCRLLFQPQHAEIWSEAPMAALPGDRWRAEFTVTEQGPWLYTVTAWVDCFKTWRRRLTKRVEAGQDVSRDLPRGAALIRDAGRRAEAERKKAEARILAALAQDLEAGAEIAARLRLALDDELLQLMDRHADRRCATTHRELAVVVDRERARFSSWYQMFPRSGLEGRRGTFKDAEARLSSVAQMGFNVLSLPPETGAGDDFSRLHAKAGELGLEIALDLAWPDIDLSALESDAWPALWRQLKGVADDWIALGVRIFRVADPDTKPFPFWEWLIGEVKHEHPDVLFLIEPCTRPHVTVRLAQLGFTQSSTRLPGQSTRPELTDFFAELTRTPLAEVLRPTVWADPPELPAQPPDASGFPAFAQRLLLAATLAASYGIHGPALEPGSEERDSEWSESRRELIALANRIRRENPALQTDRGLCFHAADNEQVLCYSKVDDKGDNAILVAVNLDPQHVQSAWVELTFEDLGLPKDQPYQVHDLLTGARYLWHGSRNFVRLDPRSIPAHVFRVRRQGRSERGFQAR